MKNIHSYLCFCYLLIIAIPCAFIKFDFCSVLFVAAFVVCSISLFSILKKFNRLSILRVFILIFPSFFYVINIIPISTNFCVLTKDDIMAVLQTNFPEAIDYLINNLQVLIFLPLIIIYFVFIVLSVKQNKHKKNLIQNTIIALMSLLVGLCVMYYNRHNLLSKPIYDVIPQIQEYSHFYNNLKHKEKQSYIQKNTLKGIYVVVIGESQNRNRMSVYGYTRHNTTPYLTKMRENENWLFFDNVYSCHTHTIPSLTYALTQKNNHNSIKLRNAYSIMDILHEFNTYWISNQKAIGYYGEPITEIGLQAKNSVFINKSFIKANPYDAALLKHLPEEKQLEDTSVIFIHLLGNHGSYFNRYPKTFNKWNDAYDNSILYNDYVVQKIFEHFSSMKDFMALIYFADHADDLTCWCHNSSSFTWEMTKIPLYAYFSDKYIKQHSEKYKILKDNQHTPFTNDMFFDTFLGILNITDKRFYVPEDDLSNEKYKHLPEDLSTLHGLKHLSDEITDIQVEKTKTNSESKSLKVEQF